MSMQIPTSLTRKGKRKVKKLEKALMVKKMDERERVRELERDRPKGDQTGLRDREVVVAHHDSTLGLIQTSTVLPKKKPIKLEPVLKFKRPITGTNKGKKRSPNKDKGKHGGKTSSSISTASSLKTILAQSPTSQDQQSPDAAELEPGAAIETDSDLTEDFDEIDKSLQNVAGLSLQDKNHSNENANEADDDEFDFDF